MIENMTLNEVINIYWIGIIVFNLVLIMLPCIVRNFYRDSSMAFLYIFACSIIWFIVVPLWMLAGLVFLVAFMMEKFDKSSS